MTLSHELGEKLITAQSLEGLAAVLQAQGHPEQAAQLFGAAEVLREAIGAPLPPADRAQHQTLVVASRVQLDEGSFNAAWARGRQFTLERAVAEALSIEM